MKILIISDLHANREALDAVQESWDRLICLGDLVDYGTCPHEILDFVKQHASLTVCGNHDHAVAFDADCGCAPPFHAMSVATRALMKQMLSSQEIEYLRDLPEEESIEMEGARFYLCHAAPTNHLYKYLGKGLRNDMWVEEAAAVDANFILVGHTHQQFVKGLGEKMFINPGSLGLSRDFPGKACYAIWDEGHIELKRVPYDVKKTIDRVMSSPLSLVVKEQLEQVLLGLRPD